MTRRVSYAQNGEDIVLARGLTADRGFYVDVGAYDPNVESVTRLFYERGWRGINIDPIASFVDRFDVERPRDINICAAIGRLDGEQQIWASPAHLPGHSTSDAAIAASHELDGHAFTARSVKAMTLETALDRYLPPGQEIDFLKVDVEGAEVDVIAGWNPARVRPRVVVVEAFAPYVGGSTHDLWEPEILAAGYHLALFDGLNRFYVRENEPELARALSAPANVLDNFIIVGHQSVADYAAALELELAEWKLWTTSLNSRVIWLEGRLAASASATATGHAAIDRAESVRDL